MSNEYFLTHLWLIPLFPLAGAALMMLLGRRLPKSAVSLICAGSVLISFIYSVGAVWQLVDRDVENRVAQVILFQWIPAGPMHTTGGRLAELVADWGVLLDPLSAVMILVVTGVGLLIHVYSIGYMGHERGYYRFFGYLNLFMFSMLTLVLANNMLLMFVGWEGVGLCSYLLIGFYFLRKSATDAGKKAFIVNRIGDAGFLLGIFLTVATFGTIRFTSQGWANPDQLPGILQALTSAVNAHALSIGAPVLTAIALLLFVGATGKSAQIPLYVWLPDAMEGPTPVSALIHAATMVTAGVYMVARMNAIYQLAPLALAVVAAIGGLTAIFAASIGLVQTDIKKVLAYSTISQLGYMFLALGVGAFAAGVFHLMTHAFFKALLFLGSGSVIHALSGEQDMRKMGALWSKIPVTAKTFFIATLAIAGIPPFAGFFSKDEILWKAWRSAEGSFPYLWLIGFGTALMTAFYMARLLFLTFYGQPRMSHEVEHHIHESPKSMTGPLVVLAICSVCAGWLGVPASLGGTNACGKVLEPVFAREAVVFQEEGKSAQLAAGEKESEHTDKTEYVLMFLSLAAAGVGWGMARRSYLSAGVNPERGYVEPIAAKSPPLYAVLYNKWFVDEVDDYFVTGRRKLGKIRLGAMGAGEAASWFDAKIIDGAVNDVGWVTRAVATLSKWWDKWIIDGLGVNAPAILARLISYPARLFEWGLVKWYALVMVAGLLGFGVYYVWK